MSTSFVTFSDSPSILSPVMSPVHMRSSSCLGSPICMGTIHLLPVETSPGSVVTQLTENMQSLQRCIFNPQFYVSDENLSGWLATQLCLVKQLNPFVENNLYLTEHVKALERQVTSLTQTAEDLKARYVKSQELGELQKTALLTEKAASEQLKLDLGSREKLIERLNSELAALKKSNEDLAKQIPSEEWGATIKVVDRAIEGAYPKRSPEEDAKKKYYDGILAPNAKRRKIHHDKVQSSGFRPIMRVIPPEEAEKVAQGFLN